MIPIQPRKQDISVEWLTRASKAQAAVAACTDDRGCGVETAGVADGPKTARQKRAALFDKYAALWSELKPTLSRWSYDKCWYTEAREAVSDYHVDHFRPKSRVKSHLLRELALVLGLDELDHGGVAGAVRVTLAPCASEVERSEARDGLQSQAVERQRPEPATRGLRRPRRLDVAEGPRLGIAGPTSPSSRSSVFPRCSVCSMAPSSLRRRCTPGIADDHASPHAT